MSKDLNEYEQSLIAKIAEHGWFATHVFDPDGQTPNFSYTTGFAETLSAPEFIVFGLGRDLHHSMLWEIFRQIKAGSKPTDGQSWQGLLEGHDVIGKAADHPDLYTEYTVSANWHWRYRGHHGHPPVMQLIWPGAQNGLYPWDAGCSDIVKTAQPRLWP